MQNIHKILRDYFGFTLTEARGFWVWGFLMLGLIGLNLGLGYLPLPAHTLSTQERQNFDKILATLKSSHENDTPEKTTALASPTELFSFNPQEATAEDLLKLGIPPRTVKSILNYREKGGKFRKKTDLQKIYGFPPALYTQLEPYIDLPAPTEVKGRQGRVIAPFSLNVADTATVSQVRGIGSKTALNILKYREKLGGFVHMGQLSEVYYLKDKPDLVAEISKYAYIDLAQVRKIKINQATVEVLKAHPYFFDIAGYIVKVRTVAGKAFTSTDFEKLKVITPEKWQKIKPYLDFE